MKILLIAPHPFYQERGTPIAVDILLQTLSGLGHEIHLLTYHEGLDRSYENVTVHRTLHLSWVKNIPPGPSWQKIVCDVFLAPKALALARKHRYDFVHAVEEAAFVAVMLKTFFKTPFAYDMDSSMATQIADKYKVLDKLRGVLETLEAIPIKRAEIVVPVCDELAAIAHKNRAKNVVLLKDITLRNATEGSTSAGAVMNIREAFPDIQGPIAMYIGNLESYQGIDLLLHAFVAAHQTVEDAWLVIIGGSDADIAHYKRLVEKAGMPNVLFLGRQPVAQIGEFMAQASVLVSPRTEGQNTPMKLYSYMDSGKPIAATNISSHTQVLTQDNAMLSDPDTSAYAAALISLFTDTALRERLAANAKAVIEAEHTREVFESRVRQIYDIAQSKVAG